MVPRPIRLTSKPERPKCAYVIPSLMSRLYERRFDPVFVGALALFAVVNRPDASLLQEAVLALGAVQPRKSRVVRTARVTTRGAGCATGPQRNRKGPPDGRTFGRDRRR